MPQTIRIRIGRVELRPSRRQVFKDGQAVPLGGRAFDVLTVLVEQRHRIVSRDELFDRVWPNLAVEPNNLQVQVWALRRLLGPDAIVTVPRRGYRYAGPEPLPLREPNAPAGGLGDAMTWGSPRPGETSRRRLRWGSR